MSTLDFLWMTVLLGLTHWTAYMHGSIAQLKRNIEQAKKLEDFLHRLQERGND